MQKTVKEVIKWLQTQPQDAEVHADKYEHNKRRELIIVRDFKDGKVDETDLTVSLTEEE